MPLTPDMRRSIDQIRDYLFGGGYPDPVSNAEQLAFLFFFYLVEGIDAENQARGQGAEAALHQPVRRRLDAEEPAQRARRKGADDDPARPLPLVGLGQGPVRRAAGALRARRGVRRSSPRWRERPAVNFMHGARLAIDEPTVLTQVVTLVDGLRLDQVGRRHQGRPVRACAAADQAGRRAGPVPHAAAHHPHHRRDDRPQGRRDHLRPGRRHGGLPGRGLQPHPPGQLVARRASRTSRSTARRRRAAWATSSRPRRSPRCRTGTFFGNDVDPKMVRLATMNLTLRGLPNVRILLRNVLTTTLDNERKARARPAPGGLPRRAGQPAVLRPGGQGPHRRRREGRHHHGDRAAVPQVHDGQPAARRALRRHRARGRAVRLHRRAQGTAPPAHREQPRRGGAEPARRRVPALLGREDLGAVLPQGRHAPRTCCSCTPTTTATSWTPTTTRPSRPTTCPALVAAYRDREASWQTWHDTRSRRPSGREKWWFADAATLRANDFNLSAGRYRPMSQAAVEHRDPRELLDELAAIEAEIAEEVEALRLALAERAS